MPGTRPGRWDEGRALLVPTPVIAKVGFLLARGAGATVEAAFLRSIVYGTLTVVDLQVQDYARMAELVEIYDDFPLGTTDAAVVAVAERLGVVELATLVDRHFRTVRPHHVDAFALLP